MTPDVTHAIALQEKRKIWADAFPKDGNVRAKQAAAFCQIAESTWWLYVNQGKIKRPTKFGARISVWRAGYVRDLASNGIPQKVGGK